jgi:hypothetical protein
MVLRGRSRGGGPGKQQGRCTRGIGPARWGRSTARREEQGGSPMGIDFGGKLVQKRRVEEESLERIRLAWDPQRTCRVHRRRGTRSLQYPGCTIVFSLNNLFLDDVMQVYYFTSKKLTRLQIHGLAASHHVSPKEQLHVYIHLCYA